MTFLRQVRRIVAPVALWALSPAATPADVPRIITLSPHAAELVAAAGGSGHLVGIAAFTDEPAAAADLPQISDAYSLDRERVLELRPDLVVAWNGGNRENDIAWLEKRGIGIYLTGPASPGDIPREIRELGTLIGTPQQAAVAASALDAQINGLRNAYADAEEIRYVVQLWHRPPMTFGADALLTRSLRLCRARNAFGDVRGENFTPDPETLRGIDPDIEIIPSDLGEAPPLTGAQRVLRVDADALYRPSPRFVTALARLCTALRRKDP